VRTPSRIDRDFFVPASPPYLLAGGSGFVSEKVIAYEAGYRIYPLKSFLIDAVLYYNTYDDIRSVELQPDSSFLLQNGLEATTYGGRVAGTAQIMDWWKLKFVYIHFQKTIALKPWSNDANKGFGEGNDPRHRLFFQSTMDIGENWDVDFWVRYIDALPNTNAPVPAYTGVDARVGRKITDNIRASIMLQNIFTPWHTEFGSPSTRYQIGREIYAKISFSL
ncbi:MAG: TonB-dependent receptor, partial [Ignavibacteriales bacterium]|nr:TonB-dependent receptor [Ignavibacteriales bacterium]